MPKDQEYQKDQSPFQLTREQMELAQGNAVRQNEYAACASHNDGQDDGNNPEGEDESQLVLRDKPKLKKPPMYQVVLLNDDYTPMDFVVDVLQRYFDKSYDAATEIMLAVHHQGRGICGVFTFEIAETKVKAVTDEAKARSYPLKCVIDPK